MSSSVTSVLSSIWKYLATNNVRPGESEDVPLVVEAAPGLMTLLDVALFRSVEGEITATVLTGHGLLLTWIEVKRQAIEVIRRVMDNECPPVREISASTSSATRRSLVETLARICLEASCDAIERITTDKLAQTANLSDPYVGSSYGTTVDHQHQTQQQQQLQNQQQQHQQQQQQPQQQHRNGSSVTDPSTGVVGGVGVPGDSMSPTAGAAVGGAGAGTPGGGGGAGSAAYQNAFANEMSPSQDTGRRVPLRQRPRDCWESPRLFCPDYVWADDAVLYCQRLVRNLYRHSAYSGVLGGGAGTSCGSGGSSGGGGGSGGIVLGGIGDGSPSTSLAGVGIAGIDRTSPSQDRLMPSTERQVSLLIQLLQIDLPASLIQFRDAIEADSIVTKRLYLVKCEYRAPFRAFLEAHQSVQRAPRLALIEQYLAEGGSNGTLSASASTSTSTSAPGKSKPSNQRKSEANQELQKLLKAPELVEALALERQCEEYEVDMARAVYPFCELSRFLDHKRARLRIIPGVLSLTSSIHGGAGLGGDEEERADAVVALQETIRRLKGLCGRSGGGSSSGGGGGGGRTSSSSSAFDSSTTTTGIRPLLLDLQGVPRDEEWQRSDSTWLGRRPVGQSERGGADDEDNVGGDNDDKVGDDEEKKSDEGGGGSGKGDDGAYEPGRAVLSSRLEQFLQQLDCLGRMCKTKNAFRLEKKSSSSSEIEIPASIVRGCTDDFDAELFRANVMDWYDMVRRQHDVAVRASAVLAASSSSNNNGGDAKVVTGDQFEDLSERIRRAEMHVSMSAATEQSLDMVRQRLEMIRQDRQKRFELARDVITEVCLREMSLHVQVTAPHVDKVVILKPTKSAKGIFDIPLLMEGEPLPIG